MNLGGNYNFGVWNPPTSTDLVRYSQQYGADLALSLNNMQRGKEKGIQQSFGVSAIKFLDPDIDLIVYLNDSNKKVFTGMVRQGWGGINV